MGHTDHRDCCLKNIPAFVKSDKRALWWFTKLQAKYNMDGWNQRWLCISKQHVEENRRSTSTPKPYYEVQQQKILGFEWILTGILVYPANKIIFWTLPMPSNQLSFPKSISVLTCIDSRHCCLFLMCRDWLITTFATQYRRLSSDGGADGEQQQWQKSWIRRELHTQSPDSF